MKKNSIAAMQRVKTLWLAGIICCGVRAPAQTPAALVSNAVSQVRLNLEAALEKTVPSLSLVVQTSNETYFASAAATPAQALTPDTYFRFASNTKNFTAAAVLHLHQQGWLDINDKIIDSIPGYDMPYVPANSNWNIPNKHAITIRQLLGHSAGVYDVDNDDVPGCGGTSYTGYQISLDPAHQFTVEEMVAQAALHQLSYFKPDEGYHYSNTGFAMLSEIIARVYSAHSGAAKTCSDYLQDHIIGSNAPVYLPEIHFPNLASDTALPEPFVPGTTYLPSNQVEIVSNANLSAQVGEGNGYGTLSALNRYIRTMMKGENVLNTQMVSLMQTNTAPHNVNYSFGCFFTPDIGYGHNGSRVGYLSMMAYHPDRDLSTVVCLPVQDWSRDMESFMKCFNALYEAANAAAAALGYQATPVLTPGADTNFNLAANIEQAFVFTATAGVYYTAAILDAPADAILGLAPAANPAARQGSINSLEWVCPAPGTYKISVVSTSAFSCRLQLTARDYAGPLITANGLTGSGILLTGADRLNIAAQVLRMDDYIGVPVDWWIAAWARDAGAWYYLGPDLAWAQFDGNTANCRPVFQGAVNNLAPVAVAQDLPLAPGVYQVWFALDYPMDGILNLDGTIVMSSATVTVQP